MSKDIASILDGWEFDPDEVQVRIVTGDDGREKLQMRLDLGLLQMELSGRPDGTRVGEHESLLDALQARAREEGELFTVDHDTCVALMREGVQYYHRYLSLFHLKRYDLVARDTERNLRLFDFVKTHAASRGDVPEFEQFRPYVTMMLARARAMQALDRQETDQAIRHVDDGIEAILAFLHEYRQDDSEPTCRELIMLRNWRRELQSERVTDPLARLDEQLRLAVAREQYEEAARIRDQIQRLRSALAPPRSAAHDDHGPLGDHP